MKNGILKNVIIYDGEKEYFEKDILNSIKLLKFFNSYYIINFPKSIEQEVISENGIFYITTDKEFKKTSLHLKDVSNQLNNLFLSRYK